MGRKKLSEEEVASRRRAYRKAYMEKNREACQAKQKKYNDLLAKENYFNIYHEKNKDRLNARRQELRAQKRAAKLNSKINWVNIQIMDINIDTTCVLCLQTKILCREAMYEATKKWSYLKK